MLLRSTAPEKEVAEAGRFNRPWSSICSYSDASDSAIELITISPDKIKTNWFTFMVSQLFISIYNI